MLKKFNLLCEEIMDDLNLGFRFNRASRLFGRLLSADEKRALNKKYNKAIEELLSQIAGTDQKIRIGAYSPEDKMFRVKFGTIQKVDNGIVTWVDKEGNTVTTPISRILIDELYDMIHDDEEKFMQDLEKQKAEAAKAIEASLSEDVQYLIKHQYLNITNLIQALSKTDAKIPLILSITRNKEIFNDKHILDMFDIDTNSKEFKDAEQSAKASGEAWYYMGGTSLILKVVFDIKEGERFDISRITNVKFEHEYERSSGYGTKGEF